MLKTRLALLVSGAMLAATAQAEMETEAQKLGYAFGYQMAENIRQQDLVDAVDAGAITAAIQDVLGGKELQMTPEEMQGAVVAFQQKLQAEMMALAEQNGEASKKYLEENAKRDGVKTTESGLQYRVITEGKGDKPTKESSVEVHYQGSLVGGKVFDSSYDRGQPATLPLGGVSPGWQEGLALMSPGAKYELTIPPELAYGLNAPAEIGPNQVLVFEVELLSVK